MADETILQKAEAVVVPQVEAVVKAEAAVLVPKVEAKVKGMVSSFVARHELASLGLTFLIGLLVGLAL